MLKSAGDVRKRLGKVWLGLAASLAVIGASAGITLGVLTLTGVTFQGESAEGETVQSGSATHLSLPTMAVDTDTTGNTYTANSSYPADTNNQDNRIVSGTVEPCSLLAMPALGTSATRNVDILLKDAPNAIATDVRLILKDSAAAVISPNFAEIVSFNATPFSDSTQDTDLDGDPPPASGGTGSDPAQAMGFLNLPVDPASVGGFLPGSQGGSHRAVSAYTQPPSPIPANTVNAFATATISGVRTLHVSADQPHNGTEVENGATAPYQSNSANGVTTFRATIRVKNLASGANGDPFFVGLDLAAGGTEPGSAVVLGKDTNGDGDFSDSGEEENNPLPSANMEDGGLQVAGTVPSPCPPAGFLGAPEGSGSQLVGGPLLTGNRDRLAICVRTIGLDEAEQVAAQADAKSHVETALVEVAENPQWALPANKLTAGEPLVETKCDAPSSVYEPVRPDLAPKSLLTDGRLVAEASYYRFFVFVIPDPEVDRLTGGLPRDESIRLAPEESISESGDVGVVVTNGLYVSPSEAKDVDFLVRWLEAGLGFRDIYEKQ